MKCARIFFMVHIFLLFTGLVGFSVESQAGLFRCSECTELHDNTEKSNSDKSIPEEAPICKICAEKISRRNISVDESLSPVYEQTNEFKKLASAKPQHQNTCLLERQNIAKKQAFRARRISDDATCFVQSMCDDESDSSIGNPELWKIIQIEESSDFIMRLMMYVNAAAWNVVPEKIEQFEALKLISVINKNSRTDALKNNLEQLKTYSELVDDPYCMKSHQDLPDFFVTDALTDGYGILQNFLLEKKTPKTIQATIERIERTEKIERANDKDYYEVLYLIHKKKELHGEITLYPLIINVDSVREGTLLNPLIIDVKSVRKGTQLHFFNPHNNIWYKISGKEIPAFIKAYIQWGATHNYSVGVYSVLKPLIFLKRQSYEKIGFNNHILYLIIQAVNKMCKSTISVDDIKEHGFDDAINREHFALLTYLKDKVFNERVKKIHTPYIEWYKKEWCGSQKSKKSFVLKLLGTTTEDGHTPEIIVTQLSNNTYGVSLLQDTGPYLFLTKQHINIFAKQLMWVSDAIVVHEIEE